MRRQHSWIVMALLLALPVIAARAQVQQQGASAAPSAAYAGSQTCAECHRQQVTQFAATPKGGLLLSHPRNKHESLGCELCHGPSKQHVQSGGEEPGGLISFGRKSLTPVAERNATCLQCHDKTARMLWKGSAHEARNVACTDCHSVMHAGSERANLRQETVLSTCGRCHAAQKNQQMRFAHMPLGEQKVECTSCHNPHGSAAPKLLIANSINETCYSCHAEKRGPFLWEHAPVNENCANCHDPHGSSHEKMLKVSRPRLCQQCHANATGHPAAPRNIATSADLQFVYNRQCSNCHFNIHGSNHPSGKAFTR
jgi:DmsE family decaheme c-type cytochrome